MSKVEARLTSEAIIAMARRAASDTTNERLLHALWDLADDAGLDPEAYATWTELGAAIVSRREGATRRARKDDRSSPTSLRARSRTRFVVIGLLFAGLLGVAGTVTAFVLAKPATHVVDGEIVLRNDLVGWSDPETHRTGRVAGTHCDASGRQFTITGENGKQLASVPLSEGKYVSDPQKGCALTFHATDVTDQPSYTFAVSGIRKRLSRTALEAADWSVKLEVPPTLSDFGQQYLEIVKASNHATSTFEAKIKNLSVEEFVKQQDEIVGPLARTYDAVDQMLLRVDWPSPVQSKIEALVKADEEFQSDLATVGAQNAFTFPTWAQQTRRDRDQIGTAASIVRAALHLPPPGL